MAEAHGELNLGQCISWSDLDVPTIWGLLAYEDGNLSAEQAVAWNRTYDLLAAHAKNLQALRDRLAERWPPEGSAASGVFLEYLDQLIGSVHPASYASASNAVVLSELVDTLVSARAEVQPLHEQWQATVASGTPDPQLRARLNQQAAAVMSRTDSAVYEHGQRFILPPEYVSAPHSIEPSTPFPPPTSTHSTAQVRPVRAIPAPQPQSGDSHGKPALESSAPSLSGGVAASPGQNRFPEVLAPQPIFTRAPTRSVPMPGGVIGSLGMNGIPRGYGAVGAGPSVPGGGGSAGYGLGGGARSPGVPTSGEVARRHASWPPSAAESGEVAPRSAGSVPSATESGEGAGGTGGMLGGYGPNSARRRQLNDGDAYTEWPVRSGSPSVLMPRPQPDDHDPGPGVIGIDR